MNGSPLGIYLLAQGGALSGLFAVAFTAGMWSAPGGGVVMLVALWATAVASLVCGVQETRPRRR